MQIDIIGVPIDLGADRRGVDMGPSAMRYAHLRQKVEMLGKAVEDKGNIEVPIAETCSIDDPKLKYIDCIVPMARRAAGAVATSVQNGHFPVVLGGDHSLSLGSVRGAAKNRRLGLLWIDAHADFNTDKTTPSGNIHGMPLGALCGLGDARLTSLWDESPPVVDPRRVAVIGARDLDPGEKANLREAGVTVMGMEQIDRLGMSERGRTCDRGRLQGRGRAVSVVRHGRGRSAARARRGYTGRGGLEPARGARGVRIDRRDRKTDRHGHGGSQPHPGCAEPNRGAGRGIRPVCAGKAHLGGRLNTARPRNDSV